jgi:hypothetical protein
MDGEPDSQEGGAAERLKGWARSRFIVAVVFILIVVAVKRWSSPAVPSGGQQTAPRADGSTPDSQVDRSLR